MFDLGTSAELLIIALAVLVLLGPKEIPTILRFLGRTLHKFRSLTAGIRAEYAKYLHEGEFEAYQHSINTAMRKEDPQANQAERSDLPQQQTPSLKRKALKRENRAPITPKE